MEERKSMVRDQLKSRGISDERVLAAVTVVPRHMFVPSRVSEYAYADGPLPIGHGQTISQPYIVALMTEVLHVGPTDTVLEIGTGSGYQAAVLAELADQVYTIEIIPELGEWGRSNLERLHYTNVHVKIGDGYKGWPEHAPFDRIILTAAPPEIPQALIDQLEAGGRLIAPVGGSGAQDLIVLEKTKEGTTRRHVADVRFVPMVHGEDREDDGPKEETEDDEKH
jgi:protein-L-isoaspartate(D-aspartate) O-methyltransferase